MGGGTGAGHGGITCVLHNFLVECYLLFWMFSLLKISVLVSHVNGTI